MLVNEKRNTKSHVGSRHLRPTPLVVAKQRCGDDILASLPRGCSSAHYAAQPRHTDTHEYQFCTFSECRTSFRFFDLPRVDRGGVSVFVCIVCLFLSRAVKMKYDTMSVTAKCVRYSDNCILLAKCLLLRWVRFPYGDDMCMVVPPSCDPCYPA